MESPEQAIAIAVLKERAKWVEAIMQLRVSSSIRVQEALDFVEWRASDGKVKELWDDPCLSPALKDRYILPIDINAWNKRHETLP